MAMSGEAEIVTVDKIAFNILHVTVLIYCVFGQTQCRGNDTNRVRTQRLLANKTTVAYEQHDGCIRTTQRLHANDTWCRTACVSTQSVHRICCSLTVKCTS